LLRAVVAIDRWELVPLEAARGRVIDRTIVAAENVPHFARALMDGFALRAADCATASQRTPAALQLRGEVLMGTVPSQTVEAGGTLRIHTGAMMPAGADTVLMLEDADERGAVVTVRAPAVHGDNVLHAGEDVPAGAIAFVAGTRIRIAELGGLAALGIAHVPVRERPRIAVLSTGDEVVPVTARPGPAQVRDVNAITVAATIEAAGGIAIPGGIVADDVAAVATRAAAALAGADALVISAGSSVSHRDVTAAAIAQLGGPGILAHGLGIRPGKPTILAVCNGKPVIGLPGNPVAAVVIAWRIVRPLVRALGGERAVLPESGMLDAVLATDLPGRAGREDFVPCRLDYGVTPPRATPLLDESNVIFAHARSDGLAFVPFACAGLAAGEHVRVVV
jgi:molybdopterin molybdotransferase